MYMYLRYRYQMTKHVPQKHSSRLMPQPEAQPSDEHGLMRALKLCERHPVNG